MKKIIFLVAAMMLSAPLFSQFNWGVKFGASTNNLSIDQSLNTTSGQVILEQAKEATYGFHGGVFARLSLLGIYVQPEILFATSENKIKITDVGETVAEIRSQKFNKIDIPVMLGFKLGPLRINGGPAATIMLSSPKELFEAQNYESLYKSATFGYQAGVGVDIFNKLTLDLRYEGNLNQFGNELTIGSQTFELDQRSSAFSLSLGFIF